MEHLKNLPNKYQALLEWSSVIKLRANYHNYFIITTQDTLLKERQKRARTKQGSIIGYRKFEREYLQEQYGIKYGHNFHEYFFKKSRRNKF